MRYVATLGKLTIFLSLQLFSFVIKNLFLNKEEFEKELGLALDGSSMWHPSFIETYKKAIYAVEEVLKK